jgi:selenocysteine lyase/cysteine desulfurase
LIYGGTGSYSDSVEQPEILPDRYESGTPNLPGILGLGAAAEFVRNHGSEIAEKSLALAQEFRQRLSELEKVKIYGPEKLAVPLISVNFGQEASEEVARVLSEFFQIAVRGGLHCAPLAHRTIGTETQGTVRFSFGYGNTQEDVEAAYKAAVQICLQL